MPAIVASFPLSPADTARAVAQVYSISLLATAQLAIAGAAVIVLQRASAGARALVWRGAAVGLLLIYLGHALPVRWIAFAVPDILASPLVALGRLQVSAVPLATLAAATGPGRDLALLVWTLLLLYATGVLTVLVSIGRGWLAARAFVSRANQIENARWLAIVDDVRRTLGLRRPVRLAMTHELRTPVTCGVLRPVVLMPSGARAWTESDVRAVLLHELAHIEARDIAFALVAHLSCALYWFHPGAWLVARGLHRECEVACDDRVLAAGVRPSDYAELLAKAADGSVSGGVAVVTALTGPCGARGLRGRLTSIVDVRRRRGAPPHAAMLVAAVLTLGIALPMSVAQLAPTREILTRLMREPAWESRAYAVIGLARRPDSVAVVRSAAALDPSPRVRALAEAALGER